VAYGFAVCPNIFFSPDYFLMDTISLKVTYKATNLYDILGNYMYGVRFNIRFSYFVTFLHRILGTVIFLLVGWYRLAMAGIRYSISRPETWEWLYPFLPELLKYGSHFLILQSVIGLTNTRSGRIHKAP